jgi:hypothetical protein
VSWPTPLFTKSQINKAGEILIVGDEDFDKMLWAFDVLNNWRSCHGYPINTFQATLRQKLKAIDSNAIVAQRLKRMPSIVGKLWREKGMKLSRMQDIGGLRAVVSSLKDVYALEKEYRSSRFQHELINNQCKDYIASPKSSGYRSIHLIYRYKNARAPEYDGLLLELQLRTKLQHAWATAVETMGTFLNHPLKSSEGPSEWLKFFSLAGSAFAHLEKTTPVAGYETLTKEETFALVVERVHKLDVINKLHAFTVAAERVITDKKGGSYHLILLDTINKNVTISSFSQSNLEQASKEYSEAERRISAGELLQAVLVSAGSIDNLRKAYPNYFLDTHEFVLHLNRIEKTLTSGGSRQAAAP